MKSSPPLSHARKLARAESRFIDSTINPRIYFEAATLDGVLDQFAAHCISREAKLLQAAANLNAISKEAA
ncbi:MAG: hypothetical protein HY360_07570 [Verrucomicrobia bacterium]|nr:hypothetical protein [Verrucomicrobiota bacterium]